MEKKMLTPEDSKRVADRMIDAIERIENKAILLIEEFDAKIRYEGRSDSDDVANIVPVVIFIGWFFDLDHIKLPPDIVLVPILSHRWCAVFGGVFLLGFCVLEAASKQAVCEFGLGHQCVLLASKFDRAELFHKAGEGCCV